MDSSKETPKTVPVERNGERILRVQLPPLAKKEIDPWTEVLDPHEADPRQVKPLNPGNRRVLPPSLKKGTKRTKVGKNAERRLEDVITFCNREYNIHLSQYGSPLLFDELKGPFYKKLKERQKRIAALRPRRGAGMPLESDNPYSEPADMDDDSNDSSTDYGADDGVPFSNELPVAADAVMDTEDDRLPAAYSDYLEAALQKQIDDLAYNDKLTDIDKRVKKWESSVRKSIEEAEKQPPFDMQHYSDSIFSSFPSEESDPISFDTVLEGKNKSEAFRTFVSALILANHGNIDIVQNQQDKTVKLSLLHKTTLSEKLGEEFTTQPSTSTMKS